MGIEPIFIDLTVEHAGWFHFDCLPVSVTYLAYLSVHTNSHQRTPSTLYWQSHSESIPFIWCRIHFGINWTYTQLSSLLSHYCWRNGYSTLALILFCSLIML
jgi:hypothetical protein